MRSNYVRAVPCFIRYGLSGLLLGTVPFFSASAAEAFSQGAAAIDAREQLRQQERERALQNQNTPQADARVAAPERVLPDYPPHEKPCFTINRLVLVGESAERFQWALAAANDAKGRCRALHGAWL
ncbi:hypothetical protein [Serratia sp. BFP-2025]|uniref:hypothetical protein n=1 Tax=Serratia sp. BFP-2025 TaxID=3433707 RepID=UPI003D7F0DE3